MGCQRHNNLGGGVMTVASIRPAPLGVLALLCLAVSTIAMAAPRTRPHPARLPSARRPPPRRHPNPTPPRRPSRLRQKTDIPSSRRFGAAAYLASVSPQGVSFRPPLVTRPEGVGRALSP